MSGRKTIAMVVSAAVGASLLGGCKTFETKSFWGPAHKLSGLGTSYGWKPGEKCEPDADKTGNPEISSTFLDLVDTEFAKLGYRRISEGKPDFLVCHRIGKFVAQAQTGLASWDEAVLEVDLTDPATGGNVWRGRVQGRIDYSAAPEARKHRMQSAVRELVKPLPKAGRG
jgi:hypothetical protein